MRHQRWLVALVLLSLSACGIPEMIKQNDDRYARPGALDMPLNDVYDTYQFRFLDRYRITHQWPRISNCSYRKVPTLGVGNLATGDKGEFYAVRDIYESEGKTWQRFDARIGPYDFDHFVRSVISKERHYTDAYGVRQTFPSKEEGYRPICFESWWTTSTYIRLRLQKRNLETLREVFTQRYPEGRWSERRVGNHVWQVQETAEKDFRPPPLNGVGGPFQAWLLPMGDTGYTMALELGASQETLKYPDALVRFQAMFQHLIESVKIEPLP